MEAFKKLKLLKKMTQYLECSEISQSYKKNVDLAALMKKSNLQESWPFINLPGLLATSRAYKIIFFNFLFS